MSDKCPKCVANLIHVGDETTYNEWKCGSVGCFPGQADNFFEQSDRCRKRQLENLLRGWLTAFQKYGPSGSHQWEKFDAMRHQTEVALGMNGEGR